MIYKLSYEFAQIYMCTHVPAEWLLSFTLFVESVESSPAHFLCVCVCSSVCALTKILQGSNTETKCLVLRLTNNTSPRSGQNAAFR